MEGWVSDNKINSGFGSLFQLFRLYLQRLLAKTNFSENIPRDDRGIFQKDHSIYAVALAGSFFGRKDGRNAGVIF